MSGITGIYHPDGRPADAADLERMGHALARRGPAGAGCWVSGAVALGSRAARPGEAGAGDLPLAAEGALVLTADARIDNREELAAALGLHAGAATDTELILAAYATWGERCPERLVGDFAFALWDGRRQALFCARDCLGVRPLYYHHSGRSFALASEIKALLALPQIPRRLNEERLGDYLLPRFQDLSATFYRGVHRLPPGHTLTVTRDGARLRRYWSLDGVPPSPPGAPEEQAAAFREIFVRAVTDRLRDGGPAGSMLSGGLDSSSVVCVARRALGRGEGAALHTFSALFGRTPECDERDFIQMVLAGGGLAPHYIDADGLSPLEGVACSYRYHEEPFFLTDQHVHRAMYRQARDLGVRVVLDGLDGDATVSHGLPRLAELLRSGRWPALRRETAALARHTGTPWGTLLRRHALGPFVPEAAWQARRVLSGRPGPVWGYDAVIRDDFARRVGLYDRMREERARFGRPAPTVREGHRRQLEGGLPVLMAEVTDREARWWGVEARHPFFDRRLVEFCYALPAEARLRDGWPRAVVRDAMRGILPEEVRLRAAKTDRNPSLVRRLLTLDRARLDDLIERDPSAVAPYVDVDRLRLAYRRFAARPTVEDLLTVWKTATLALWLRQADLTP
ncbi:MAG TPA: asparagine synthase-related protein [Dehalococcoidia bacterium]